MTISNNTIIGERAFSQIGNLTSITIELADLAAWCSNPNIFSLSGISIPNSCTCYFSMDGKVIEDLIIPSNITEIDNNAFKDYNLKSITMEITDLIAWCINPLSFNLHSSCTRYLSLNGNIIKDLVIPQSVTSIGAGAFSNCNSLTSVKVEWNRPLAGGAASFPEDVKKNVPLYVPKGTAMMYMSAPGWSEFVNIVEYEDGEDAHYITIRMGDGGVLKQSVEVGQTYTYAVSADEGWEVNTLTFDGKDMTSLLLDGQFSTPVITSNSELNVVFKQIDTNVKAIPSMSEVKVYASNKNITITGAEENAPVSVYGINGALVTSAVGNATFTLESGVYVVKVGEETFKVRL